MPNTLVARHPYTLGHFFETTDSLVVRIHRMADDDLALGLTNGMVRFFTSHAMCRHCEGVLTSFDLHLDCGATDKLASLEASVPLAFAMDVKKIYSSLQKRPSREVRARLVAAGGSHTNEEVRRLYESQGGRCFYCFTLINFRDRSTFHKDHFVAVTKGGTNEISNIVLACPACNMDKSSTSGAHFAKKRRATIPGESLPDLLAMQSRVMRAAK